jgi:hypothetical protein
MLVEFLFFLLEFYPTLSRIPAVFAATCSRTYTIKAGDFCDKISQAQNVSTCVFDSALCYRFTPVNFFFFFWCVIVGTNSLQSTPLSLTKVALTSLRASLSASGLLARIAQPPRLSNPVIHVPGLQPRMD